MADPLPSEKDRRSPKKRRRIVVSCTECHRRKQKCDRELPCANCTSRNKADRCTYDDGAPTAKEQKIREKNDTTSAGRSPNSQEPDTMSSRAVDMGYSQTGTSTIGFLQKIESADDSGAPLAAQLCSPHADPAAAGEKYKALIRQLPSRPLLVTLKDLYFRHFNWYYYFLEEAIFDEQLEQWNNLPFSALGDPMNLPDELRAFPALLFQVIATALLVLPDEPGLDLKKFEALKYSSSMTWDNLASDYSENGMAVLRLFKKRHVALTTVQAQFTRTAFMKYSAEVADSWHMLASAIRDAQELGLHRDSLDPKPKDSSLESILENQWLIQVRRKMFMILTLWDVSCALILGRPALLDWSRLPSLPVEVEVPRNRRQVPLIPRNPAKDPPTNLTRVMWLGRICQILKDIHTLEQEGPHPKDFTKVSLLHERVLALQDETPPFFRLKDPDTQWDGPDMTPMLQDSRSYFHQLNNFCILALHRPYIFHRRASREAALQACLSTLDAHRGIFSSLPMISWRNYMLFFGSFDAIVVVASIFILFPHEQTDRKGHALQHFRWTIDRFSVMGARNPLAKSALSVLRAILARFAKAVGVDAEVAASTVESVTASNTPVSSRETIGTTPNSLTSRTGQAETPMDPWSMTAVMPGMSTGSVDYSSVPTTSISPDGVNDDGGLIMGDVPIMHPLLPTNDLVWNDLSALDMDGSQMNPIDNGASLDPNMFDWQFGGGFGDDTIWQFLNNHQPGQA